MRVKPWAEDIWSICLSDIEMLLTGGSWQHPFDAHGITILECQIGSYRSVYAIRSAAQDSQCLASTASFWDAWGWDTSDVPTWSLMYSISCWLNIFVCFQEGKKSKVYELNHDWLDGHYPFNQGNVHAALLEVSSFPLWELLISVV